MDTPRKISAGRGSSRLVSSLSAPLVAPTEPAVDCGQILADGAHEPVINAVAVKLPELWTNRVRGWFACPSPNFFMSSRLSLRGTSTESWTCWPRLPVLSGGPVYMLAGCFPYPRNLCRNLHRCPRQGDLKFQGPCQADLEQRLPVHFVRLVGLLLLPRHRPHHDHGLSLAVQRGGREKASAVEGHAGGSQLLVLLALGAALGPHRPQERALGGLWCLFSWASLQCNRLHAWPVPVPTRAYVGQVPRRASLPRGPVCSASSGLLFLSAFC